jgi:hypothetical protein
LPGLVIATIARIKAQRDTNSGDFGDSGNSFRAVRSTDDEEANG